MVDFDSSSFYFDIPLHVDSGKPLELNPGRLFWVDYHGVDGAISRFQTHLLQSVTIPAPAWQVRRPRVEDVHREQRREFVRVHVDFPVRVEYQTETGPAHTQCYARDISGGGISLLIPKGVQFLPGTSVEVKFTIPRGEFPVNVRAHAVWVGEHRERGDTVTSFQFSDIRENVRQRIIQYTFWRQRMMG